MKMTARKVTNYYPRRHSISPVWMEATPALLVGPQDTDRDFRRTHGPRAYPYRSGHEPGTAEIVGQTSDNISSAICPIVPNLMQTSLIGHLAAPSGWKGATRAATAPSGHLVDQEVSASTGLRQEVRTGLTACGVAIGAPEATYGAGPSAAAAAVSRPTADPITTTRHLLPPISGPARLPGPRPAERASGGCCHATATRSRPGLQCA